MPRWVISYLCGEFDLFEFEFLIQKKNMKALENFSLAASMLVAMAVAVVFKMVIA